MDDVTLAGVNCFSFTGIVLLTDVMLAMFSNMKGCGKSIQALITPNDGHHH